MAIEKAEFKRFRGFERMAVQLSPHAYIVGPNSAGKSTVLESIALAQRCLQIAFRQSPSMRVEHRGQAWRGYPMPRSADDEGEDPVRYEFGQAEARASIYWENGAAVHMVWPEEQDDREAGYFYLEAAEGMAPRSRAAIKDTYAPVTLVPVVTPLDRIEELKNAQYVRRHATSRLASRHFRNHALQMQQASEWDGFRNYVDAWLPEIQLLDVHLDAGANRLGIFYSEQDSRVPKELAWAGDGIQIWLQLLWHIFRSHTSSTVVLDEPEVYLHPDLQRRLVRLLDTLPAQVILASHSADVITEAPPDGVVWVDRRSNAARKVTSQRSLSALSASLGSSFNLALARSMRARLVVASDCADLRVLRALAKHVGALTLADEDAVSIVQLKEVRGRSSITHLGSSLRELLPERVPAVVLLQAGLRSAALNEKIASDLSAPGNEVLFLPATEVENHLLDADALARTSGAAPEAIEQRIVDAIEMLREDTRSEFSAAAVLSAPPGTSATLLSDAENAFHSLWTRSKRELVRGSQVLQTLNVWLEAEGYRPATSYALAKSMRPHQLSSELFRILSYIDDRAG